MSEVAQLQKELDRHTDMDEQNFGRLFAKMEELTTGIALINQKQNRSDDDNKAILKEVAELRKDLTAGLVSAAESKGSFSSFKTPVMVIISGLIGGSISQFFKLFDRS